MIKLNSDIKELERFFFPNRRSTCPHFPRAEQRVSVTKGANQETRTEALKPGKSFVLSRQEVVLSIIQLIYHNWTWLRGFWIQKDPQNIEVGYKSKYDDSKLIHLAVCGAESAFQSTMFSLYAASLDIKLSTYSYHSVFFAFLTVFQNRNYNP